MTELEKNEILQKAKQWFKNTIIKKHIKNMNKLSKENEFNINPFLLTYLSNFLEGDSEPKSIAKALIYPRVLGTSINTSFGTNIQEFTSTALSSLGSAVSGIDIEFIDQIDGKKKYCQLKSGPNTINKDDIKTIIDHFQSVRNLSRTNNLNIGFDDLIVGVIYGEQSELNAHYKKINANHYNVIIGEDFWHRLTGDKDFYFDLIKAINEVAKETNYKKELDKVVIKLSQTNYIKELSKELNT